MSRWKSSLVIVLTVAFTASAVGVPVALYFCTMQGTLRTGECCCAPCAPTATSHGERITARACIELTNVGAPLRDAFLAATDNGHQSPIVLVGTVHASTFTLANFALFAAHTPLSESSPPPLLRSSLLLI